MKIKKFRADNFSNALMLVKKEMGDDAVILATSEGKNGTAASVEVMAAIDFDIGESSKSLYKLSGKPAEIKQKSTDTMTLPSELEHYGFIQNNEIKNEIEKLRNAIEGMKNFGCQISLPTKKMGIFNFLRERSVAEEFAISICERAADIDDIPSLILSDINMNQLVNDNKNTIMLIGPTGVGKTTTIAKLSARAIRDGKRAVIISLDTYRIGAIEQVRIYSRIMGIPLEVADDVNGLNKALSKHSDKDAIFIDTTGRNPMDGEYLDKLRLICEQQPSIQMHLLLSMNSSYDFMLESYRYYCSLPIDRIAFTKMDEAVRFGSIYNLLTIYKKPIAYITTGQNVPDDIEFPDSEKLANLVLKCGHFQKSDGNTIQEAA